MTEIKLANGNNIEVTKQGLLIKGNNIRVKIGDSDVVAIIGDNSYSVHEDAQTTTRGTVGRFEGDTSVKQAKTNLELEGMINELSTKVTSLSYSLVTKSYVSDAISSERTRAQSRLTNKSYGQ